MRVCVVRSFHTSSRYVMWCDAMRCDEWSAALLRAAYQWYPNFMRPMVLLMHIGMLIGSESNSCWDCHTTSYSIILSDAQSQVVWSDFPHLPHGCSIVCYMVQCIVSHTSCHRSIAQSLYYIVSCTARRGHTMRWDESHDLPVAAAIVMLGFHAIRSLQTTPNIHTHVLQTILTHTIID